jgi:tRNA-uridine 2-sulfurtransferase
MSKNLVYVMLSGGVDSSVAAAKLLDQGYDLVGVFMKCWSMEQIERMHLSTDLYDCSWEDDVQDAQLVAGKLCIPFEVWDFQDEYYNKVVKYMIDEYQSGRTPNPDVMCNGNIKFGIFYDKAMERGADFVATGHYARMSKVNDVR